MSVGKQFHEIRDAVHTFVRLESAERAVVDSAPYQRLRNIHQLAMTYLVYPGACHTRFEHCLGVMELATRIYDVVTAPANSHRDIADVPVAGSHDHIHWRETLRMAALCHDLGHLPFSHAAEDILPEGQSHEDISLAIIRSEPMRPLWDRLHLNAEEIGKLAVGPKHYKEKPLSDWEALLSEIITGDAFGADRMDYLLRDSLHAGVSYGHFEHHRLIDSLRILPTNDEGNDSSIPVLGVDQGGLQSAESLVWARYFMYTQLYFHHVRRIYDFHLKEFLSEWLPKGRFSSDPREHGKLTDIEVLAGIRAAATDSTANGHIPASRILRRQHFRLASEVTEADRSVDADFARKLLDTLEADLDHAAVYLDEYSQKAKGIRFPVLTRDGAVQWSTELSPTLRHIPTFQVQYVFVAPEHAGAARKTVALFREQLRAKRETPDDQR